MGNENSISRKFDRKKIIRMKYNFSLKYHFEKQKIDLVILNFHVSVIHPLRYSSSIVFVTADPNHTQNFQNGWRHFALVCPLIPSKSQFFFAVASINSFLNSWGLLRCKNFPIKAPHDYPRCRVREKFYYSLYLSIFFCYTSNIIQMEKLLNRINLEGES